MSSLLASGGFQSLVDIGFVLFVIAACYQSLFSSGGSRTSAQAVHQTRQLESSLREMIDEASAAGSNLNRSLLKRKDELQSLIQKIDEAKLEAQTVIEAPRPQPLSIPRRASAPAAPAPKQIVEEDLPNDSWRDGLSATVTLEELADRSSDTIQISKAASKPVEQKPVETASDESRTIESLTQQLNTMLRAEQAKKLGLGNEIEVMKDSAKQPLNKGFVGSSVDPSVYRIARRLLASGKEIHVVARKLELPVAEVRLIDRMLREELGEAVSNSVSPARAQTGSDDRARFAATQAYELNDDDWSSAIEIERSSELL
jgi:hypothetical protein